ncbi:MAG: hypothetical protein ACK5P5_14275 [Pseudobdellovibrionaceae bacterium]
MNKQTEPKLLLQYFENIQTKKQKEFVHLNNNCLFCQEVLEIKYEKKFEDQQFDLNEIRELVFCPQCELKSKSCFYMIQ